MTGDRILPGMKVTFAERSSPEDEEILIAFHKPVGIVCIGRETGKNNIIDYIGYPKRTYPVGRLE